MKLLRSRSSFALYPLVLFMTILCGFLLGLVVMWLMDDPSILSNAKGILNGLFLGQLIIFQLIMFWTLVRKYVFHPDKLEVNYFFGLLRHYYPYQDLKISNYFKYTAGVLIQTPDGDQLTLGVKQYRNFYEIKQALEERITVETIKVKLFNKFTKWMSIITVVLLVIILILEVKF